MQYGPRLPADDLPECDETRGGQEEGGKHLPLQQGKDDGCHAGCQLPVAAFEMLGNVESGHRARGEERRDAACHQQGNDGHGQHAGPEEVHDALIVAFLHGQQEHQVGHTHQQQHGGNAVVALAAGTVDAVRHRHGAPAEEQALGHHAHPEGGVGRHQIGDAGEDPEQAADGQRTSLDGRDARPGGTSREQEAHRDGDDEAPEHFMGVPEHAAQRALQHAWEVHPQQHAHDGPEAAEGVERAETEFQKGGPLRACGGGSGFFDREQHGAGPCRDADCSVHGRAPGTSGH